MLVEDAALSIDSYYNEKPLGSFGQLAAFSFHETKNIQCGEGGMLVINDPSLVARAEVIWEKGTNRTQFQRGEVSKYDWIDIGSSFLPSEITAAYLFGQLEKMDRIRQKRMLLWERYHKNLLELHQQGKISMPEIPVNAVHNRHTFFFICESKAERDELLSYLNNSGIQAIFHYLPLHLSPYYSNINPDTNLPNAARFSDTLVRLPLYHQLKPGQVDFITREVSNFFSRGIR
jgi:dTDP-4-amino-4,6-dideoxygalactose transaminase